jgi:hypothetical protein
LYATEVDDEVRCLYEEKYSEPVPTHEEWRTRRLIPVSEARRQLGGIGRSSTFDEFIERRWVQ